MPQVANTRKDFQFLVEIGGINQFLIQKVTHPEVSIDATEHGEGNIKVKTAGMMNIDDMVFEKVRPAPQSDTWAWDWLTQAQNPLTGGGNLASGYKRTFVLRELHPDGIQFLNSWIVEGAWVKSLNENDSDRMSSEAKRETVTLSVDRMYRI